MWQALIRSIKGFGMKARTMFMAGAAIGYVLGTKAGRERYEQLKQASRRLAENPTVQEAAGVVRAKGGELAGVAKERMPEQLGERIAGLGRDKQEQAPAEYQDPRRETAGS